MTRICTAHTEGTRHEAPILLANLNLKMINTLMQEYL